MSAASDGNGEPGSCLLTDSPGNNSEAINASKRQSISRKCDVELVFSRAVDASTVVDAIVMLVGSPQAIGCIQQLNSRKFLVSFKSAGMAEYFSRSQAPALCVSGSSPVCRWLGTERKRIRVAFLPYAVSNDELVRVLKNYGQVLQVTDEVYANKSFCIKTGTRLVEMDMVKPVPNIITVCGFSVPVTYRGVVIQCRRCLREGHVKAECTTPFCDRCKSFGHDGNCCTAPCLKCKAPDHHWRDCTVRSYAFAAARNVTEIAPADIAPNALEDTIATPLDGGRASSASLTAETLIAPDDLLGAAPVATSHATQEPSIEETSELSTSTIGECFNSATEDNSENEIDKNFERVAPAETKHSNSAAMHVSDVHAAATGRCELPLSGASAESAGWQRPKQRSHKRKTNSITPDKVPEAKKAASRVTLS